MSAAASATPLDVADEHKAHGDGDPAVAHAGSFHGEPAGAPTLAATTEPVQQCCACGMFGSWAFTCERCYLVYFCSPTCKGAYHSIHARRECENMRREAARGMFAHARASASASIRAHARKRRTRYVPLDLPISYSWGIGARAGLSARCAFSVEEGDTSPASLSSVEAPGRTRARDVTARTTRAATAPDATMREAAALLEDAVLMLLDRASYVPLEQTFHFLKAQGLVVHAKSAGTLQDFHDFVVAQCAGSLAIEARESEEDPEVEPGRVPAGDDEDPGLEALASAPVTPPVPARLVIVKAREDAHAHVPIPRGQ